ncbi:hypothetical protein DAPPUDRAFT_337742 [Daphnia pulex]|uniref:Secreted protein n=1 Tax=Daphnia pulex TaxID=6669 RepID=E9I219_DAPPU|nr:hypothetical protein DAPPUDRAFT_337742 [Daphnia pulex]|eukprot:EFX61960.1 hypothetical protein DAPPUDRAFT_337742 [Daphnia pulex]
MCFILVSAWLSEAVCCCDPMQNILTCLLAAGKLHESIHLTKFGNRRVWDSIWIHPPFSTYLPKNREGVLKITV